MTVRLVLAAALAVAAGFATAPASATECTPKGCSASCHLNRDWQPGEKLVICYS
jgi:hypothetical protein